MEFETVFIKKEIETEDETTTKNICTNENVFDKIKIEPIETHSEIYHDFKCEVEIKDDIEYESKRNYESEYICDYKNDETKDTPKPKHKKSKSVQGISQQAKNNPIKTQEDKNTCAFCQKIYKGTFDLESHYLGQHRFQIDNLTDYITHKVYSCTTCSYLTLIEARLESHNLNHSLKPNAKKYICEICSFESYNLSHFSIHRRKHSEDGSLPCQFCTETFKAKVRLDYHILRCHKDRLSEVKGKITSQIFTCTTCSYQTVTKFQLRAHMKTHDKNPGARKNTCAVCGFENYNRRLFTIHMRLHGDMSTKCQVCAEVFKNKRNLNSHILRKHRDEINDDELEKVVTTTIHSCKWCSYKTINTGHLNNHVRDCHKGMRE